MQRPIQEAIERKLTDKFQVKILGLEWLITP